LSMRLELTLLLTKLFTFVLQANILVQQCGEVREGVTL
jgi:hypothetical protein